MTHPILFSRVGLSALTDTSEPVPRFMAGTGIATPDGPRPIEALAVGDAVTTQGGAMRIARLAQTVVPRADWAFQRGIWPVRVPVGSLGNPRPIRAAPDQRVLLRGATVERMCGAPQVSVALSALVGLRGLTLERPLADLRYLGIGFEAVAVIEAEGAFCEVGTAAAMELPRETLRDVFRQMHAAGEPPLRGIDG